MLYDVDMCVNNINTSLLSIQLTFIKVNTLSSRMYLKFLLLLELVILVCCQVWPYERVKWLQIKF